MLLLASAVLIFVARCVHELLLIHDLCRVLNRGGANAKIWVQIFVLHIQRIFEGSKR